MLNLLTATNSIINHFIAELRDTEIQQDRMRFRNNLERLGEIIAYEISKTFVFQESSVKTPLGTANIALLKDQPVICSILRAGLPMHNGLLRYFDRADNAFVSAFRKHKPDGSFDIQLEYVASPSIEGRTVILSDPMLATGSSLVQTYRAMLKLGTPSHTHIAVAIASTKGIEYVKANLTENITLWIGAIDPELNANSYIVPGLGDAGDLAFGEKMEMS